MGWSINVDQKSWKECGSPNLLNQNHPTPSQNIGCEDGNNCHKGRRPKRLQLNKLLPYLPHNTKHLQLPLACYKYPEESQLSPVLCQTAGNPKSMESAEPTLAPVRNRRDISMRKTVLTISMHTFLDPCLLNGCPR